MGERNRSHAERLQFIEHESRIAPNMADIRWLVTWHPDRQTDAFYLEHADLVNSIGFRRHRRYLEGAIQRRARREAKRNG